MATAKSSAHDAHPSPPTSPRIRPSVPAALVRHACRTSSLSTRGATITSSFSMEISSAAPVPALTAWRTRLRPATYEPGKGTTSGPPDQ